MASTIIHADVANYATLSSTFESRNILKKYLQVIDDEWGYRDWLEMTGRREITTSPEFQNLTESSLFKPGYAVGATTAGAANTAVTVVFNGTTGVKPFVSEVVMFKDYKKGYIASVTASSSNWSCSIKPIGTGNIIPAIADGETIIFTGNAQGEGSELVATLRQPTSTIRTNNIQLFTTKVAVNDVAGSTQFEIPFGDSKYIVNKVKYQQYINHGVQVANELLTSVKGTTTDADQNKVWFTNGLRPQIKIGGGISLPTIGSGVFNVVTDMQAMSVALDNAGSTCMEYMMFAGQTFDNAVTVNSLTNTSLTGGAVTYAAYNGNKEIALAFGVSQMSFGGRTVFKKRMRLAQHSGMFGATGYTMKSEAFVLPTDRVKSADNSGTIDRMRIRFMGFEGNSERYHEVETGAFSSQRNNAKREKAISIMSNEAVECAGIEHFMIMNLS
jgi:hypothetical protein